MTFYSVSRYSLRRGMIMNKRQKQKQTTKAKILSAAKQIYIDKGILNTATSQIAQAAGIAHGTLFLHFPNKDILVLELIDEEMSKFSESLKELILESSEIKKILQQYLQLIIAEEGFFSTLAKEMPFYNSVLRRKILFRESLIREHFHKVINDGIKNGSYKKLDIPSALNFLFGTINYYLSLRSSFVQTGSVIKKFQKQIISTFLKMLK